jgi:serine/threonine protein kinase
VLRFQDRSETYVGSGVVPGLYFPYGDLENYITQGIAEDGTKVICAQLLEGLSFMHRIGFTHRDLKPQVLGSSLVCRNPYPHHVSDNSRRRTSSLYLQDLSGGSRSETLAFQKGQPPSRQYYVPKWELSKFQAPEILGYVEELDTADRDLKRILNTPEC